MTRSASPKLGVYAAFAAAALLLGLVLGSPALIAFGAPFAVLLVVAFAGIQPPRLEIKFTLARERAVEGDRPAATIEIANTGEAAEVELLPVLPSGLTWIEPARIVLQLGTRESRTLQLELSADRWGAYRVGEVAVRVRDRFGLVSFDDHVDAAWSLRVYPHAERLPSLIRPVETQPYAGNQVARAKGEGIEFADIRPFVRGDRVRRINWRATARRTQVFVNEARPERNSDVVLFLDSFADATREHEGVLDLTVRAAASIAREYLEQRDRVGIVGFGGVVRWLTPAMGRTQRYRIADALLETEVMFSYAWKGIDVLPPRSLPPQALIIALSPLLDERGISALLDLRTRGFDLVIVDVSPIPFARAPRTDVERIAHRLWPLWRQTLRSRYERLGVAVLEWTDPVPLAELLEEGRRFRRYARRAYG